MHLKDTIHIAIHSLLGNKLRTLITVAIITLGLTALIGILTSIEAMKLKIKESFSFMGANTFTIRASERKINLGSTTTTLARKDEKSTPQPVKFITAEEANLFKSLYNGQGIISVRHSGQVMASLTKNNITTNPTYPVLTGDENYLQVNGHGLSHGRNMNAQEVASATQVCILGIDAAKKIYKNNIDAAINDEIKVNGRSFQILGVLASKGNGAFSNFDNLILIPHTVGAQYFKYDKGYNIGILVPEVEAMEGSMQEVKNMFKPIRKIALTEEPNFTFEKSDRLASLFINASNTITFAAIGIGIITLIGAAIGLMNIMLVSVNERTKEIGLLKALGAKKKTIERLFLVEGILIALGGAVLGTAIGVLIGNLVGYFLKIDFFVPWGWVTIGVLLCAVTGILAGLYPAFKAGKLNPIEALRYE